MALETINIGQIANDGTGDDLREAFIKVNNNFNELDTREHETTTAVNLGTSGEGVFSNLNGAELQFKRLVAGTDVTLNSNSTRITINANGGLKSLLVTSDSGNVNLPEAGTLNVLGGAGIATSISGNNLTIVNDVVDLSLDPSPELGGDFDGQGFDMSNIDVVTANAFVGDLFGLVFNIDIRDFAEYASDNSFNFGEFSPTIGNILDWLISETVVDFGTFNDPEPKTVDLGSFL